MWDNGCAVPCHVPCAQQTSCLHNIALMHTFPQIHGLGFIGHLNSIMILTFLCHAQSELPMVRGWLATNKAKHEGTAVSSQAGIQYALLHAAASSAQLSKSCQIHISSTSLVLSLQDLVNIAILFSVVFAMPCLRTIKRILHTIAL